MFIITTGIPGSGKTYYAVHYADKHIKTYQRIFTNINGHKYYKNIEALNFPEIEKIITKCYTIYHEKVKILGKDNENKIDDYIIDYLLEIKFIEKNSNYEHFIKHKNKRDSIKNKTIKNILNFILPIYGEPEYKASLLIIDEASNIFGEEQKLNKILLWWIRYHRHLFMDVILISQDYQEILIDYRRKFQYYLDAVPDDAKALKNKFKYNKYRKTPYYKSNKTDEIKIPKEDRIFKLYQSGDRVRSSNKFWKIIGIVLFIALLGIAIIAYIYNKYNHNNKKEATKEKIKIEKKQNKKHSKKWKLAYKKEKEKIIDVEDKKILIAKCNHKRMCKIDNFSISQETIEKIYNGEIMNRYKLNNKQVIEILTNKDIIKKRKKDEKITSGSITDIIN